MSKRFISLLLSIAILVGCLSTGFASVVAGAREVGVGTGAESFNPVNFYASKEVLTGTEVDTSLVVEMTDKNYKVKINSISAFIPYYIQGGVSNLNVSYTVGKVVSGTDAFTVTGTLAEDVNSVVRYTIEYDLLDTNNETVWKNLTGYTYALVSSKTSTTGAVGTYYDKPGELDDGCYFSSLDTLNTCYVQQSELVLGYTVRTQHFVNQSSRTRGVEVISGNAPSTLVTMPDSETPGVMYWPDVSWVENKVSGEWLSMTEPLSDYYNFTISFNSWNDDWDDQTNITETTEMYYIRNSDKVAALNAANKIMKTTNTFNDGYYVQKGLYTTESWNNLINAIDIAYQVAYAVPNANYGYKLACMNAQSAAASVDTAFEFLQSAEHDFTTYKDVVRVEPTCTEKGSETYVCICGEIKYVELPESSHDQGMWVNRKAATCTEPGLDELVCTVCGYVLDSRTLAVVAHNYESVVTPATCQSAGYTTDTCVDCGYSYTKDPVEKTGHTWSHVETPPTCIYEGYITHTCIYCGEATTSKNGDPTGHNWVTEVVAPTCTEKGYTKYVCTNCNFEDRDTYVNATGHTISDAVQENVVDATCTTEGSYQSVTYCAVCGYEISRLDKTIPVKDHTPGEAEKENEVSPTKDDEGSYEAVVYCVDCNVEISRNKVMVPAYGHDPAGRSVEENRKEATCTETGSYDVVVYCTCCTPKTELSRETIEIPVIEHSYTSAVTPPTCTEAGFTTYTCSVCSDVYKEDGEASLGHTPGEWIVTKEAEVGVTGEKKLYCTVCETEIGTEEIPAITAYLIEKEGTTTVIDKENGIIYGLEEGIYDLEDFVEYEGGTLEYVETKNGFGTGTIVNFIVDGETYETYTIVIFGDVTGDSVVDTFDATYLAQIVNGDIEIEDGSAVALAADIANEDEVADTFDLTRMYRAVNGDIVIEQVK